MTDLIALPVVVPLIAAGLSMVLMGRLRAQRILALAASVVLLALPVALAGRTWVVSLWRIVNPFSNVAPVSLTHIIGVEPGETSVLQGKPVVLSCKVQGRRGPPRGR